MPTAMTHIHSDHEEMSQAAAGATRKAVERVLRRQDTFSLVLAGGSTPKRLYELLAVEDTPPIPWDQVHLFWGDERLVPPSDPTSNEGMARETLIDAVDIPASNIHPILTAFDHPETAAKAYEKVLVDFFAGPPAFDLVLLGLGEDGHTASLFPEDRPHEAADPGWVVGMQAPPRHSPRGRVSLTLPAINRARQVYFLVSGEGKHESLVAVRDQQDPALPATHVAPEEELHWFVDRAAQGGT